MLPRGLLVWGATPRRLFLFQLFTAIYSRLEFNKTRSSGAHNQLMDSTRTQLQQPIRSHNKTELGFSYYGLSDVVLLSLQPLVASGVSLLASSASSAGPDTPETTP
jgi:hypothetical protein